jgi:DNA-binding response OmpR family regulator
VPAASVLAVEDLKLDRVERRVERSGKRIELTSKEFSLLEYLMLNAGRRVTRAMIIEHLWNLSFDTSTNVVDVYVNHGLRVPKPLPARRRERNPEPSDPPICKVREHRAEVKGDRRL